MKLDVIFQENSLSNAVVKIDMYFHQKMRLIKVEHSIYDQWLVRPVAHVFISRIWQLRLVHKSGVFYFGFIE